MEGLFFSMVALDSVVKNSIGFNMDNNVAVFTTYAAFLVDGNLVTNLISIGQQTDKTGPSPPRPATAGGLATHGTFEGDTSLTRGQSWK
jgi:hypothetical protein